MPASFSPRQILIKKKPGVPVSCTYLRMFLDTVFSLLTFYVSVSWSGTPHFVKSKNWNSVRHTQSHTVNSGRGHKTHIMCAEVLGVLSQASPIKVFRWNMM